MINKNHVIISNCKQSCSPQVVFLAKFEGENISSNSDKFVGLLQEELYDNIGASGNFRIAPAAKKDLNPSFIVFDNPYHEHVDLYQSKENEIVIAFLVTADDPDISPAKEIDFFSSSLSEFALNTGLKIISVAPDDLYASYCYSYDDNHFSSETFRSIEDAILSARKEAVSRNNQGQNIKNIYISKTVPQKNEQYFPDGDLIIEHMANQAYGTAGNSAKDYPNVSGEAIESLTKQLHHVLKLWCLEHNIEPDFYLLDRSQAYSVNKYTGGIAAIQKWMKN
jgi:hypothetical protein